MVEREVFWAGLVVSAIMLGNGFCLLLFPAYTGYGAVILSLGVMTMTLVLMAKSLMVQIQKWMDYNARIEETVSTILALKTRELEIQQQAGQPAEREKAKAEDEIEIAA